MDWSSDESYPRKIDLMKTQEKSRKEEAGKRANRRNEAKSRSHEIDIGGALKDIAEHIKAVTAAEGIEQLRSKD